MHYLRNKNNPISRSFNLSTLLLWLPCKSSDKSFHEIHSLFLKVFICYAGGTGSETEVVVVVVIFSQEKTITLISCIYLYRPVYPNMERQIGNQIRYRAETYQN